MSLKKINFCLNPLDPESWYEETCSPESVPEVIRSKFQENNIPATVRIFHGNTAENCNVTPNCQADIEKLSSYENDLWVVAYPGDPVTIIVSVIVGAAVAAGAFLLRPSIPELRNQQAQSPNNSLSSRENVARPNGRIADIVGTVRSIPDLISRPYLVFENEVEIEYSDLCIGRGEYEILDARDGDTDISDIAGSSIDIYGPNTSANNSDTPQQTIGSLIGVPIYNTREQTSVNGQELQAPNAPVIIGEVNIKFVSPNQIVASPVSDIDFTESFDVSDPIRVGRSRYNETNAVQPTPYSVRFTSSGTIEIQSGSFPFSDGDTISITNAVFTSSETTTDIQVSLGGALTIDFTAETFENTLTPVVDNEEVTVTTSAIDLSGTYIATTATSTLLTLENPAALNADWSNIASQYPDDSKTPARSVGISEGATNTLVDLNGTYVVNSVTEKNITLTSPENVNPDWTKLASLSSQETPFLYPHLSSPGDKWEGPYVVRLDQANRWVNNFVALQGLFKDDGERQTAASVTIQVEITPVDSSGTPTGSPEIFSLVMNGSADSRESIGKTLIASPTFSGFGSIRARRVTPTDDEFEGTVVDKVKWRNLYVQAPIEDLNFGDVTTIQSKTIATQGALSLKERKLNLLVTRKIPTRTTGNNFSNSLSATNRADEIISAICLDPLIGGRSVEELNLDEIYGAIEEAENYFQTAEAVEFGYTFSDSNLTFQDTIATIATSVFCQAYRRGNIINLSFEKATEKSTILFNHRNKLPKTESRTVKFGNVSDHDGVIGKYKNRETGAEEVIILGESLPLNNPKEIDLIGVQHYSQAYFHVHRAYQKIKHQNFGVKFDATQEANLLVVRDRILVADGTRSSTQTGQIESQVGLLLNLSQKVTLDDEKSYTIFIQHIDKTVEAIAVASSTGERNVIIEHAPRLQLSLDDDAFAKSTYEIVANDEVRQNSFLVSEKSPNSNFISSVEAINYDFAYYLNEALDFHFLESLSDVSAFKRASTVTGAISLSDAEGRTNVLSFPASGDNFISVPGQTFPDSYSKCAWVNFSATGTEKNIISSDINDGEILLIDTDDAVKFRHGINSANAISSAPLAVDQWHHVVATFSSATSQGTLYIDGNSVAQNALDARINSVMQLGARNSLNTYSGHLDDVRYYSRCLDPAEVKRLWKLSRR